MVRERRRIYYFLIYNIKKIIEKYFIEDDIDDQQKGNRNIIQNSKEN